MIFPVLFLLSSLAFSAEPIRIQDIECFEEEESAKSVLRNFQREVDLRKLAYKRTRLKAPELEMEYVSDATDQFGRKYCLISKTKKFNDRELVLMKAKQLEEDHAKRKKEIGSMKDPWGGKVIDLSGEPKIIRSCKILSDHDQECDDLIITAMMGQEDVVEYRFWLGARSGEGLAIYKATKNALELSQVMKQLKKDKENFSYTFSPRDQNAFVKDALIGGK